jgi:general secretion pathway protein L
MSLPVSMGISISPSRAAVMGLRQTFGGLAPVAREIFDLDAGAPAADRLGDVKKRLIAFINQHRLATAGRFMAASLPSTMWRRMVLPAAAKENLADTIRYEAEKYLPLPLEDLFWDYHLIGEDRAAGELTVLLAVAKRSDMAPFMELAGDLPGGLSGVEPAASAIATVFHRHGDLIEDDAFGVLVLTADQLHLVHVQNGLLQGGRTYARPEDDAAAVAMVQRGFAALRLGDENPGSDGAFPLLVWSEDRDADLRRQVETVLPRFAWREMDWRARDLPPPDLLTAYGLALKGLQKPVMDINLLPLRLRKQPSRWGRYLMAALIALTLISGIAWGASAVLQQRFHQARLDREITRLADEVADIDRLQGDIQALRARLEFLQEQQGGPGDILDVLKALTEIIPESAWVREITIEPERIRLDGYADAAAELIPLIDASPLFTDVSFLSAITKGRDGKEKFRIGFRLAGAPR